MNKETLSFGGVPITPNEKRELLNNAHSASMLLAYSEIKAKRAKSVQRLAGRILACCLVAPCAIVVIVELWRSVT